jgi:predicted XRE-type DNA-binding protein
MTETSTLMSDSYQVSSGNVFEDLGFDAEEAALLRVKSQLLAMLTEFVGRFETQREAAEALGVKQPRVSEIATGKLSAFSTDLLIRLCERAGLEVRVVADGVA